MDRIYLDHAATTPLDGQVLEAMMPFLKESFGNPSSVHSFGREVKKAVEEAREKMASLIGAGCEEIYFTSGGTESDNLAIVGAARALRDRGNHVITTSVEHHAVLDTCLSLKEEGFEVTVLPVDKYGMVDPESLRKALREKTILISVMHANNEVGTIQPVEEIGSIARENDILFHIDGVQAVGNIPVNVEKLNVDLMSLSAHKFYGPKGVGLLYIREGTEVKRLAQGGGQEKGTRAGTENIPGIIGMAKAMEIACEELEENTQRIKALRDRLIQGCLEMEAVTLNGHPTRRLPGNVNLSFEYIEGEALLLSLDFNGIAASSGSACSSGSMNASHVLLATGMSEQTARGAIRFSLGRHNTGQEIETVLQVIRQSVEKLRSMSSIY
ncbi:cysteine desulfurase NifS [Candidatus Contubernalis alkaliaceticus]|uniref:cysteine desulfurase NifS n=1 Tax=Candidatus Contubernalis alkaliaceticus TaxID=338645 RepID=UPI001F4BE1CC|nr:cysteine desulfurase NifS [Candidatus Contubernalis alkalaceticus]UNC91425.1 cysteine desulfurase NifS [Candidatus Contubernalis alkalaceticus]